MNVRVGIGFDAHSFSKGRKLMLGGIEIPFENGLVGHSDGDVVIHAIMDSLLGAAGLGDKGEHFGSADPDIENIYSILLLNKVSDLLFRNNWLVSNIDVAILAQEPILSPYIDDMAQKISEALKITPKNVNLKVTSTDHLGFIGRTEGLAAYSIALIEAKE